MDKAYTIRHAEQIKSYDLLYICQGKAEAYVTCVDGKVTVFDCDGISRKVVTTALTEWFPWLKANAIIWLEDQDGQI